MIWPSIRFDISLENFKKPLDIFLSQIDQERKRSKEYLIMTLALKESFERFSFLEFIFEKRKHREAGLKHELNLIFKLEDSGFLLILVFVNENCCLCICFTDLFSFYWLLVVSLAILIAVPFVFIRSWTSLLQEYSKCRSHQTLCNITHRYKTIKWKNKHDRFFIMLNRNS